MNKYLYIYGILLLVINLGLSDVKTTKFLLDEMLIGKIENDNSFDFYELSIPNKISLDSLLVFTARDNKINIKDDDYLFSDPDIYISKNNKNPKNQKDSDWFSETFGNDIITVPSKDLKDIKKLYVSLYCEKKCRYRLKAYLTKEIEFQLGVVNSIKLSKHNSINFFLKINKENYEQLKIVAYSPEQKHFHILMSKDDKMPSTQNTYQSIPSWMGGYMINVNNEKGNCTYHILFQTEEESTKIKFYAFFQNTFIKITSGEPIMDSMARNLNRCYYYNMRKSYYNTSINDDKLIIQMTLFGGEALLHISGWNKIIFNDSKDINKLVKYEFHIISEKSIMIKKSDIDIFNDEYDQNSEGEKNTLHFCIYGLQKGSYMLSVNYLNEISTLQKYNFLFPGNEVNSFLPKDEITSYKIIDNNVNKKSNITIILKNIQGKAQLYGYFCDSKKDLFCHFADYKLKMKLDSNEMLLTRNEYSSSLLDNSIFIENKDNQCYTDNSSKDCKLMAIVKCKSPENNICAFSLLSIIEDHPILMIPRKTYYNFISTGKSDIYEIIITEKEINSLIVVLTSNIGDAELSISLKSSNPEEKNENPITMSNNKYSLPDVIRITPKFLNKENIVGKYNVKVYCKYFSSYNLYYYTTKSKTKKEKISSKDITSTLIEGQIIKDYFPSDLNYKIYSYTPGDKTSKDIKITLTRINIRFTFYVFLSLKDIKFNDNIENIYDERVSGYKWISDSNNEVTISINDKNYKKKGIYYILVLLDIFTDSENFMSEKYDDDFIMMYYLGLTKHGIPFYLTEGIEHSATLNKNYNYQNYIYTHYNFSEPFQFLINILNGQVDVFISTKELTLEDYNNIYNIINNSENKRLNINYNSSSVFIQKEINDYASITYKDFNTNEDIINTNYKCDIFITIFQSRLSLKYERDSQYMISAKTFINKGNLLLSGHVYKNKLSEGEEEYFIIEEVKHREILTITARFNEGAGDIFAKIIDNNDEIKLKNLIFPNSTNFDYKGSSIYMGKMIQIPGKFFEKIGKTALKIKILLTITTRAITRNSPKDIEYYLSYSDEAKRINQNIPYQSSILSGEFQYYTFYFDKNTENILISLSNMNGDADLFLNYGNDVYPTPLESDWHSNSLGHEYIDINKNDNFFKKNNIDNLAGYYTLLVIGYSDTTYTLYVSSHNEKVIKLIDNVSTNCKCETKNDKCYFRYDNVADRRNLQNNIDMKSTEIIFTSQYLYGNGKMYASVYKEQEIYGKTNSNEKKYIDYFPSEERNDFSNANYGKRNYLKVIVPENKYSIDSLILMTLICEEKTDVEITLAPLIPSGIFKYLSGEKENIFYLKYNESLPQRKQPETFLAYYSYKDTPAIYELHAYLGKAKIHIFTNESRWDNVSNKFYYEYNHISEFVIQSKQDENEIKEYKYQKYFTEDYFNTISPNLSKGKTVLFSVLPLTNFGFFIQITNERTWINVPIGKDKTYYVKNKILYGYFDIFEEFSSIEISIYLKEYISKQATIFLKLIVDNKIKKTNDIGENENNKLKHYEIPGFNNYDYKANTDNYFGAMNINIYNIPIIKNELKNSKIVRALFVIQIYNKYSLPYGYENNINNGIIAPENEGQITPYNNRFDFDSSQDCKVNILITPGVNNFKRIDTVPYTFYFSNTSLINDNNNINNKIYNGNNEVKIYSLDKISDKDDKMILQINSCSGDYNIKISSEVVNYDDNKDDINYEELSSDYGRKIFLIDKLKYKHIYLSIKSKQIEKDCNQGLKIDSNNVTCSKELSYLLHYYSARDNQYLSSEPDRKLSIRDGDNDKQLIITLPKLKEFDYHNNYRDKKNMEYNIFYTYDRASSELIESICYLGHFMQDNKDNNIYLIKKIHLNDKNEYTLDNIDSERSIYINILARNIKTNELIIYKPIKGMIKPNKIAKYLSMIVAFLSVIIIIAIVYSSYNEDNFVQYKLTNSNDMGRDDIKYSNINIGPE